MVLGSILVIIILSFFNLAVHYYASKLFYLLWLLSFILVFNSFEEQYLEKAFKYIFMLIYLFVFLCIIFKVEDKLYDMNELWGNRIESTNVLNIYSYNIDKIDHSHIQFTLEEIDMFRKLYEIGATNVINNFSQTFNHQRMWLNAYFWNEKLDYPENELFDYILKNGNFFDPLEDQNYKNINNKYNYFVIFYRDFDVLKYMNYNSVIPFEVQRRWDSNFKKDYTINKKNIYDAIDRSSCINCEFIDFTDGMIIIKH